MSHGLEWPRLGGISSAVVCRQQLIGGYLGPGTRHRKIPPHQVGLDRCCGSHWVQPRSAPLPSPAALRSPGEIPDPRQPSKSQCLSVATGPGTAKVRRSPGAPGELCHLRSTTFTSTLTVVLGLGAAPLSRSRPTLEQWLKSGRMSQLVHEYKLCTQSSAGKQEMKWRCGSGMAEDRAIAGRF